MFLGPEHIRNLINRLIEGYRRDVHDLAKELSQGESGLRQGYDVLLDLKKVSKAQTSEDVQELINGFHPTVAKLIIEIEAHAQGNPLIRQQLIGGLEEAFLFEMKQAGNHNYNGQ